MLLKILLRNADAATLRNADLIFILVVAYPSVAIQIKRWHDRNKSAGSLLINLIPYIGMLWALIELGFFDGTPGDNRYGSDPLGRAAPASNIKTYIDAQTTPYLIEVFIFLVLPGSLFFLLIRSLIKSNSTYAIISSVSFFLSIVLSYFFFKKFIKYRAYKIETDDIGLTYSGFLKRIQSKWEDVLSVTVTDLNLKKMLQVKTKHGDFIFPLSMKENNKEYPQLRVGIDDYKWGISEGQVAAMTPENCAPYLEIKERINGR